MRALAAALLLAGCGGGSSAPEASGAPQTIQISYGTCPQECRVFTITLSASGEGKFEGQGFTAVSGARRFHVAPDQFAKVTAALAPIRTDNERDLGVPPDPRDCTLYGTHHPKRTVIWTEASGKRQAIVWDTGCKAPRYEKAQQAFAEALAVLPVAPWIGGPHWSLH